MARHNPGSSAATMTLGPGCPRPRAVELAARHLARNYVKMAPGRDELAPDRRRAQSRRISPPTMAPRSPMPRSILPRVCSTATSPPPSAGRSPGLAQLAAAWLTDTMTTSRATRKAVSAWSTGFVGPTRKCRSNCRSNFLVCGGLLSYRLIRLAAIRLPGEERLA
jgi:hypothetical protein